MIKDKLKNMDMKDIFSNLDKLNNERIWTFSEFAINKKYSVMINVFDSKDIKTGGKYYCIYNNAMIKEHNEYAYISELHISKPCFISALQKSGCKTITKEKPILCFDLQRINKYELVITDLVVKSRMLDDEIRVDVI